MSSGTLYRVVLVRRSISENMSPPSSGLLRLIRLHNCVTVESLLTFQSSVIAWQHTLRNPEDGGDLFSETSVLTRATRFTIPDDIVTCYGCVVSWLIKRRGFGYRIYSLRRLQLNMVTIATGYNYRNHYSTVSFSDPTDETALHWRLTSRTELFCFQRLTNQD
jgi:hypothetical protein